jgi:histone acetyltransferase (RNA polymerase elongator complex component)
MTFPTTITLTGSTELTNFDIYQCISSGCTNCVIISGSAGENVKREQLLTGHTVSIISGFTYVKIMAKTEDCNNSICIPIQNLP